jgi:hypothetical protein
MDDDEAPSGPQDAVFVPDDVEDVGDESSPERRGPSPWATPARDADAATRSG